MGINWTILGHSERRALFGEDSVVVAKKVKFAVDNGLSVIACIGETLKERESGNTFKVLEAQLDPIKNCKIIFFQTSEYNVVFIIKLQMKYI